MIKIRATRNKLHDLHTVNKPSSSAIHYDPSCSLRRFKIIGINYSITDSGSNALTAIINRSCQVAEHSWSSDLRLGGRHRLLREMATSNSTKVLVHLRRAAQGAPYTCAQFSECVLDSLGLSGEGLVECSLQNNKLLLQNPAFNNDSTSGDAKPSVYKIMHPPFCPLHQSNEEEMANLPPEVQMRGVDVGVAALVESSDHRLLLTQRAQHMRTFPGTWVPPGGHVENGESLEEAVLREVREETGLVVTEEERKSSHILGLWESVYPPVLGIGQPRRHHVVVYLHITLSKTSEELNKELKLCPEEVDAAAWLSVNLIKLTVWSGQGVESGIHDVDDSVPIISVDKDGEHTKGAIDASILTSKRDPNELTSNRISTGSRYALSLWLNEHQKDMGDLGTSQQHLYGKYIQAANTKPPQRSKF